MLFIINQKQKNIGIAIPFSIGCTSTASGIVSNSYFLF